MTESGLATVRRTMEAALPRAFVDATGSDGGGSGVAPSSAEELRVGQNVEADALPQAVSEMRARFELEVLGPLDRWLETYRAIKRRNRAVESLRLDLDRKRRAALQLSNRYCAAHAKDPSACQGSLDRTMTEMDKMNRLIPRFAAAEAEVYQALLALITDSVQLRAVTCAAFDIARGVFEASHSAFDEVLPLKAPHVPAEAAPVDLSRGAAQTVAHLQASLSTRVPQPKPLISTSSTLTPSSSRAVSRAPSVAGSPPRSPTPVMSGQAIGAAA